MSALSIVNDDLLASGMNSLVIPNRYSNQNSYANVAATYTVLPNEKFIFCNVATTLTLPSAALNQGRNLIIVQRAAFLVSSASSNFIDIENNPNAATPTTQTGLISAAGSWVHIVSNGAFWVAVSKSVVAP
jgi:hypothetical protein